MTKRDLKTSYGLAGIVLAVGCVFGLSSCSYEPPPSLFWRHVPSPEPDTSLDVYTHCEAGVLTTIVSGNRGVAVNTIAAPCT